MNNNLFSYIKNKVSILDLIGEYTTLKKAGAYFKGCCPFHHEKTASFTVSPHKEIFYCFGCHAGGDVIAFVEKMERCSAKEAVLFLAQRYDIELPKSYIESGTQSGNKDTYFEICKYVALWCHQELRANAAARSYLQTRGITAESINNYSLGYFPGGLAAIKRCIQELRNHSFLPADLVGAGILAEGKTVLYSPFEERIIFPIKDHLGRFCGFGGRTFKSTDTRPKYYNSKENDLFQKGSLVYGLDVAKKAIQETENIFLVEGYMDCIALAQQGYQQTVAVLGTACTPQHLKLLARYGARLYVMYDNDAAGKQAVLRLAAICWQANLEPYVIMLPEGQDPAALCASNVSIGQYIEAAQDIFLFFLESFGADFSHKPLSYKVDAIRKFVEVIYTIDDPLKQDILLHKAADHLHISFEVLIRELARLKSGSLPSDNSFGQLPNAAEDSSLIKLEKRLMYAILSDVNLFNETHQACLLEYMSLPFRDILEDLAAFKRRPSAGDFTQFYTELTEQQRQSVTKLLLEEDQEISPAEFHFLLDQWQKKQWRIMVQDIQKKLIEAQQQGNLATVQALTHEMLTLRNKLSFSA